MIRVEKQNHADYFFFLYAARVLHICPPFDRYAEISTIARSL